MLTRFFLAVSSFLFSVAAWAGVAVAADQPAANLPEGMAGPLSAAEALASMETLPGLRVELVAAEPLVADPVAIDWGADGTLWVAEMADYPLGIDPPPGANQKGRPGGRVRKLRDTDGDGRLDSGGVFLDGIPFPTGVMAWRDGVIVASAPTLFFIRDADGDGRGDERIDLFTGFKEGNQQHRINGPWWGIDGWCYLANGDSGGLVRSIATGAELDLGSRDLRVLPETGRMEPVAGMSQFGRACDSWGHWFGCSNSDPCFQLGPDDPALARNRFVEPPPARHRLIDPAQRLDPASPMVARFNQIETANHFTSACGLTIHRDTLPAAVPEMTAIVCEPAHNLVHCERLDRDGWLFRARPLGGGGHLLRSSDGWFRPVMARTGPDGGIWIVDMYRAVVEHPEWIPADVQERIDLRAGDDKGRIWRLVAADGQRREVPRLDRLPPDTIVALLSSPNGTLRDLAQRFIIERCTPSLLVKDSPRPDPQSIAAFGSALREAAAAAPEPIGRATALWTLHAIGQLDERIVLAALKGDDPRLLAQAVAAGGHMDDDSASWCERLVQLATSDAAADPDLALQLAMQLGDLARPEAASGIAAVAMRHRDAPVVSAAIVAAVDPERVSSLLAALPRGEILNRGLMVPLVRMVAASGDAAAIERVIADAIGDEAPAADRFVVLAEAADMLQSRGDSIVRHLSASDRGVERLRSVLESARAVVRDVEADRKTTLAAIRLLGILDNGARAAAVEGDLDLLAGLLSASHPPDIQQAALDALVQIPRDETAERLIAAWRSAGPATARGIVERLVDREPSAVAVVAAIADGRLPAAAIDAATRQRLIEHPSAAVRERAGETLAAASGSRGEVIHRLAHAATIPGDPSRGRDVFVRRCAACHRMGDVGHEVGPNLAAVGNRSPAALLEAILDPNRVVEDRYVSYVAIGDDGRQHTGILVGETEATFTLRGQDGRDVTLRRDAVEEFLRTGKSLMPEGLENDLSPQDLADLFAAIARLGSPASP